MFFTFHLLLKSSGAADTVFHREETSLEMLVLMESISWMLSQHVLRIITTTPLALLQVIKDFLAAGFIKYHNTYLR